MTGNLWSALGMLSMTILILILAYWTSRWVGVHGSPGAASGWPGGMGNENFRVAARLGVGRNAALVVVRVGERCLLLGVTEQNITLLKEWEGEEVDAWLTELPSDNGFLNVLRDTLQQRQREKPSRPRRDREP
ncbi:MAG: flagellar biosynthetic protein FliO [Oscillibacter sp.]|nr:flagellar biosynthetic protein FliO [Oscillibacter sp.]